MNRHSDSRSTEKTEKSPFVFLGLEIGISRLSKQIESESSAYQGCGTSVPAEVSVPMVTPSRGVAERSEGFVQSADIRWIARPMP